MKILNFFYVLALVSLFSCSESSDLDLTVPEAKGVISDSIGGNQNASAIIPWVTKITQKDLLKIYMYRNPIKGSWVPYYSEKTSEPGMVLEKFVCNVFPASCNLNIPSWIGVLVPLHKYYHPTTKRCFFTTNFSTNTKGYTYQGTPIKIFKSFTNNYYIKSVPLYAHQTAGNLDALPEYFSTDRIIRFPTMYSESSTIVGYVPIP